MIDQFSVGGRKNGFTFAKLPALLAITIKNTVCMIDSMRIPRYHSNKEIIDGQKSHFFYECKRCRAS